MEVPHAGQVDVRNPKDIRSRFSSSEQFHFLHQHHLKGAMNNNLVDTNISNWTTNARIPNEKSCWTPSSRHEQFHDVDTNEILQVAPSKQ